jgi:hypothetical protein
MVAVQHGRKFKSCRHRRQRADTQYGSTIRIDRDEAALSRSCRRLPRLATQAREQLSGVPISQDMSNTEGKKPPAAPLKERRPRPDDVRAQIAKELYTTMEQLSADPELLAVMGSWHDTLEDDEILEHLRSFNRTGKVLQRPQ